MQVIRIPVLLDNYVFLLHDRTTNQAVVVDPATVSPVLRCLEELGAELMGIWNTHHHHDHVGGNRGLLKKFPYAVLMKTTLWILEIEYIKMTDNRLGFGKKLIWEK